MKKSVKTDKPSAKDRMLDTFIESLVKRLEDIKLDWKQPWINPAALAPPRNLEGRAYGGMNAFFLMLEKQEKEYEMPVWMTYRQAQKMDVSVRRGEKSFPVFFYQMLIKDKDKNPISEEEYRNLSKEEKEQCTTRWRMTVYPVFNVSQTNMKELQPEKWEKLKAEYNDASRWRNNVDGEYRNLELDYMLENKLWLCPIEQKISDSAFYSISKDSIVVPEMKQFVSNESFYATLLHEMAHSTGAESRLGRLKPASFGSEDYAKEELVAELTSVVAGASLGVSRTIKEESVAYLQSWLDNLKKDPSFIRSIVTDVKRAADTIESVALYEDIRSAIITSKQAPKTMSLDELEEKSVSLTQQKEPVDIEEDRKKVVSFINETFGRMKNKFPDALMLFRYSDRYELYFDDIERAKDILGLPVTEQNEVNVRTVSIKANDLESCLPKLIRAGQRCAIVDVDQQTMKLRDELNAKSMEQNGRDESRDRHNYMFLGRLQSDCKYYLEQGGDDNSLWAKNVDDQLAKMKEIYQLLPEEPQWLNRQEFDELTAHMKDEQQRRLDGRSSANHGMAIDVDKAKQITNPQNNTIMSENQNEKKELKDGVGLFKNQNTGKWQINVTKNGERSLSVDVPKDKLEVYFSEAKGKSLEEVQKLKDKLAKQIFDKNLKPKIPVHEDGILIFKMPKLGDDAYGISKVENGVESQRRRLSEEDVKEYFKAVKGAAPEEKAAVVTAKKEELADKYLSPEALKMREEAKAKYEASQQNRPEVKPLPEVSAENRARITEPRFWKNNNGSYAVKATIDGKEQDSRIVAEEKMAALFDGYRGASPEQQLEKRAQLANAVYADVLRGARQEQTRSAGIKR